jgi:ribosomal protein S18 acetylase RimI-like enzyme
MVRASFVPGEPAKWVRGAEAGCGIMSGMDERARFLQAYDEQLRTDAETPSAIAVTVLGPLRLVTFAGGRGFITYQNLDGSDAAQLRELVAAARAHYEASPEINEVEWKTRGHDRAPGLHESLVEHGFVPEDPESVMIGAAERLAVDVPLPDGVRLRQISEEGDVRAMCAMAGVAFGDPPERSAKMADALLQRLSRNDGMELWAAEADGTVVSAGRLEPVPGTSFAGIWGGCTLPEWRKRGIYRALTAARARSALRLGKTLMHSDSTEYSRPILERYGFLKVSTTTPYIWHC